MMNKTDIKSIYVHIPFCKSKCLYCDFVSFCNAQGDVEKYFEALHKEIESLKNINQEIGTIYFGGGTPSCVDQKFIVSTIKKIRECFCVLQNCEISVECNPNTVCFEKLQAYKNCGVNRISFGAQSLHDDVLKKLGRAHNSEQTLECLKIIKQAGFENVNADLIVGLACQNANDVKEDIQKLVFGGVSHISLYTLINEKGTPLTKKIEGGQEKAIEDDEIVKIYDQSRDFLKELGFEQYEVSAFCKNGCECKHNLVYWQNGQFYGFGVAAHSYLDCSFFYNTTSLQTYLTQNSFKEQEKLNVQQQINQIVMMGLRTTKGVCLQTLKSLGFDLEVEKRKEIEMLSKNNAIFISNGYLAICKNYFSVMNQIVVKLCI